MELKYLTDVDTMQCSVLLGCVQEGKAMWPHSQAIAVSGSRDIREQSISWNVYSNPFK